jgi:hypothetical protein
MNHLTSRYHRPTRNSRLLRRGGTVHRIRSASSTETQNPPHTGAGAMLPTSSCPSVDVVLNARPMRTNHRRHQPTALSP